MAIAVIATLSVFLAACGGDNAVDATSARGSSSAATTLSGEALTTVAQYTGVKPGKATGSPIKIGFFNADAQELTSAIDEAIRAVNESFGGVRGHPIQLVKCVASSAQQAQQCGQTFVGDPAIVAVVQGTIEVDITGFHATMSPKIPILGGLPLQPSDAAAPNSYYLSSGQFGALGAVTYVQKYTTARRVSLLSPTGSPANELAITTLQNALQAVNIDVTVARFPLDATDMSAAVTQSKAASADLVIPAVGVPQQCVAMANTLQKLSVYTPVLTFAGCLGADVRKILGDYPRWNYLGFSVSAEASSTSDLTAWRVRAFNEWFKPLDSRSVTRNSGVEMFQTVLTLQKILASIPGDTFTPVAAGNAMKHFGGPVYLGVPQLAFGTVPQMPAIGSLASRVYVYLGNDSWRDTTGGEWLVPPVPGGRQGQQGQGQNQGQSPSQSPSQGSR